MRRSSLFLKMGNVHPRFRKGNVACCSKARTCVEWSGWSEFVVLDAYALRSDPNWGRHSFAMASFPRKKKKKKKKTPAARASQYGYNVESLQV